MQKDGSGSGARPSMTKHYHRYGVQIFYVNVLVIIAAIAAAVAAVAAAVLLVVNALLDHLYLIHTASIGHFFLIVKKKTFFKIKNWKIS